MTILEAEGLRNVAVLRKTDSYVSAHLVTNSGTSGGRTSVKKVGEGDGVTPWVSLRGGQLLFPGGSKQASKDLGPSAGFFFRSFSIHTCMLHVICDYKFFRSLSVKFVVHVGFCRGNENRSSIRGRITIPNSKAPGITKFAM